MTEPNQESRSTDAPAATPKLAYGVGLLLLAALGAWGLASPSGSGGKAKEIASNTPSTTNSSSAWKTVDEPTEPPPSPAPSTADHTSERIEPSEIVPVKGGPAAKKKARSFRSGHSKNRLDPENSLTIHWDEVPEKIAQASVSPPNDFRNTRHKDYAGAESCKDCHKENYADWYNHAHRLMNAEANDETVAGDFSGKASLNYLGGMARFHSKDGERRMTLERDGEKRSYNILRTLGSRFFQYYIGTLVEGPEPADHPARTKEHLLPVGWWIDNAEIVPIVHVHGEAPDGERYDPFAKPTGISYDRQCAVCHTTIAAGDWVMHAGGSYRMQLFSPRKVDFFASKYLSELHPDLIDPQRPFHEIGAAEITELLREEVNTKVNRHTAINLGISCEACHLGCAQHAENENIKPLFFLSDPTLHLHGESPGDIWEKTPLNKNWLCSRCHSGERPQYASGADTWNSTDYSDAIQGFCYDPTKARNKGMKHLTCVHCHDPHKGIGKRWSLTPRQNDEKCLACHEQFKEPKALADHTHHSNGSEGSRCMNCHMPKITEGLQDMIRTHMISNPTDPRMIEANQPNACNLCHLDKPIDWTIASLRQWYGAGHDYDEAAIATAYPNRKSPTADNYLRSSSEAVRLAASQALFQQRARWALKDLIGMLDDPYLINRQFTEKGFQQEFGFNPREHGYRFTMTEEERAESIGKIRRALLPAKTADAGQ